MSTTPYDTGKVKIGCNYTPKRTWEPSRTESMLQSALIDSDPPTDWDGIVIGAFIAALIASPFLLMAWRVAA